MQILCIEITKIDVCVIRATGESCFISMCGKIGISFARTETSAQYKVLNVW